MKISNCKLPFVLFLILLAGCNAGQSDGNISTELRNSGFDEVTGALPDGWHVDNKVKDKGTISLVSGISGGNDKVLSLKPNSENSGEPLLGVGQLLDATAMRGKSLNISVMLGVEGASNAIVGVHVLGKGDLGFVQIRQNDNGGVLNQHHRKLNIAKTAKNIVVYAIVEGRSGNAFFDDLDISIAAAPAAKVAKHDDVPSVLSAAIKVNVKQIERDIPDTLFGSNIEWIFNGQGLWSEKDNSLSMDAVKMTKEMGVSLLRFPGGVFSDYYHWQEGLRERDKRLNTLHYPGGPQSIHNFGVKEASDFAEKTESELLITVNVGTGTVNEAAEWVEFMNMDRAVKGLGKRVNYWEIGNELYMKGDLSGAHMSPAEYAERFEEFADAMLAVDPSIEIGGIGGLNYGSYNFIDDNSWTEVLLKKAADKIDFLAVHNAYAPVLMGGIDGLDPGNVYDAVMTANVQIEKNLVDLSLLLDEYETPGKEIDIAITEWGPFYHILPSSPWVDHIKTMGSAIFVASTMNSFLRSPRVKIANFFKLTDYGFMGWIGRKDNQFVATAPYHVFSLYANGLGENLVQSSVDSPVLKTKSIGIVDGQEEVAALDVVATHDPGQNQLALIVVNRHQVSSMNTLISLKDVTQYGSVDIQTVTGTAADSHTGTELPHIPGLKWANQVSLGRFEHGSHDEIQLINESFPGASRSQNPLLAFEYDFPPLSVTRLTFRDVQM